MLNPGGSCRIDSVEVAEVTIRARGTLPGAGVQATFVLLNEKTGERFGSGTFNAWSDATTTKLNEAIKAMEADIASMVFTDVPTNSGSENARPLGDAVPGL